MPVINNKDSLVLVGIFLFFLSVCDKIKKNLEKRLIMENIKLGVIGTNFVSDWLCDSVKEATGIELFALYSRTEEKGSAFAEKHGISAVYTDMDEFFSSGINAVYIASPNFCHFEQAKKALGAGLHVLLEKPAALNKAQFEELLAIAENKSLIILEAMRPVHDPALDVIRGAVKRVGTVRRVSLEYCQYSSRYDAFRRGEVLNAFNPAYGNASVMDLGCYAIAVCVALFGKPESVISKSEKLDNGFEGMGRAILEYPAFQADIAWAKICESVNPPHVTGEDGSVLVGKVSTLDKVEYLPRNGEKETLVADREGLNMIYEVEHFVDAVNGKLDVTPYHKISLEMLDIIDLIREQNGIRFE